MSESIDSAELAHLMSESDWLASVARRLVGDAAEADDVVQDVWVKALQRPPEHTASPKGWLATIARRNAIQDLRSRARRAGREEAAARPEREPSAAELAAEADAQARVARCVVELPAEDRELVLLHFYRGLSVAEIARRRDSTPRIVRARLDRTLGALRGRLDDEHGGDGRTWVALLLPLAERPVAEPALASGGAGWLTTTTVAVALALASVVALVAAGAHDRLRHLLPPPVTQHLAATGPAAVENAGAMLGELGDRGPRREVLPALRLVPAAPVTESMADSVVETAALTVFVRDRRGEPIEAAGRVVVRRRGAVDIALDGMGMGRFEGDELPVGTARVVVTAEGFRSAERTVELASSSTRLALVLDPPRYVEVCVRDRDGRLLRGESVGGSGPAPRRSLRLALFGQRPAALDSGTIVETSHWPLGHTRFNRAPEGLADPGDVSFWIDVIGSEPRWVVLARYGLPLDGQWLDPDQARLDFTVDLAAARQAVGAIELQLAKAAGRGPAAGVTATLYSVDTVLEGVTDAEGKVRFDDLLPGPYDLALVTEAGGLDSLRAVVEPAETTRLTRVIDDSFATIAGELVDAQGEPIVGTLEVARLDSYWERSLSVRIQSDDAGRFESLRAEGVYVLWGREEQLSNRGIKNGSRRSEPFVVDSRTQSLDDLTVVLRDPSRLMVEPPATGWLALTARLWNEDRTVPVASAQFCQGQPAELVALPGRYRVEVVAADGRVVHRQPCELPAGGATLALD